MLVESSIYFYVNSTLASYKCSNVDLLVITITGILNDF